MLNYDGDEMESAFDDAFCEIQSGVRNVLKEFTRWCADGWLIDNHQKEDEMHSDEYMAGWNAAMTDGLDGALAMFLDEMKQ